MPEFAAIVPGVIRRLKKALNPLPPYRWARFAYHFVADPTFRRDHLLWVRRPAGLYQYRTITEPNRYPAVFDFLRSRLEREAAPRLLSFGCATGEEVFSLHEYLARAAIKGIDINPASIAACRRRAALLSLAEGSTFECAATAAGEEPASYDAVLALAVFQRPQLKTDPSLTRCDAHLRFADFERTTAELARCVKPGGYLAIAYSVFRFSDTAVARDFTAELSGDPSTAGMPRFDRENRRIPNPGPEQVVFRRKAG